MRVAGFEAMTTPRLPTWLMPFAVLGAMSYVAKRNVKPDEGSNDTEGS